MNKNSPEYKEWINTGAAVICLCVALLFWYGYHKLGVPHFFVGAGWFLRSAIHSANRKKIDAPPASE